VWLVSVEIGLFCVLNIRWCWGCRGANGLFPAVRDTHTLIRRNAPLCWVSGIILLLNEFERVISPGRGLVLIGSCSICLHGVFDLFRPTGATRTRNSHEFDDKISLLIRSTLSRCRAKLLVYLGTGDACTGSYWLVESPSWFGVALILDW